MNKKTPNDRFRLDGRTALVTGASRGLGAAMVRALAEAGADVVLHASREAATDAADAIAADWGVRTACVTADLARPEAAAELVSSTLDAMGTLDILVNNTGIIRRAAAAEYSDADWDEVIAVNLSSVFRLCRAGAVTCWIVAPGRSSTSPRCCRSRGASACRRTRRPRGESRS